MDKYLFKILLAILATEQVLGRELSDRAEQERFVAEFLAQQNGGA